LVAVTIQITAGKETRLVVYSFKENLSRRLYKRPLSWIYSFAGERIREKLSNALDRKSEILSSSTQKLNNMIL